MGYVWIFSVTKIYPLNQGNAFF